MAISDKRSRVESYPYLVRKASDILTSTLAAFLFSIHPKTERDQKPHINFYTSACKQEETAITPQDKIKSNYDENEHASLTKKYI